MKKYFIIRILVILLYIGVIWYGFTEQSPKGYIVISLGLVAGVIINYFNYRVNFKNRMEQQNK